MLYVEYHKYKTKYYEAQKNYDEILSEKERLFAITQPKSTTFDKEIVSGGSPSNSFDNYLILKEKKQLDERLREARSILEDRERLLSIKEEELRYSTDWHDIAYKYKYIDNLPVKIIKDKMPYCKTKIYEILKIVKKNVNADKNGKLL